MKKNLICGLDIGSFKICASCGIIDAAERINILANCVLPAEGIRAGRVIDNRKLSACIRQACRRLRQICGLRVNRVYANIDSPDLRSKIYQKEIPLAEHSKINKLQIEGLISSTISANVPLDRKVVYTGFQDFKLADRIKNTYPEDSNLETGQLNIVVVSALIPTINSITRCIKNAGLILDGLVPSGCAQVLGFFRDFESQLPAAESPDKERVERKKLLIDIGADLTKITLFQDKLPQAMAILPLGAQSITEDIAEKLKVSFDCAEQLKIKHGQAYCQKGLQQHKIIIKDKLHSRIIQPQRLYEIISLKVDHLLQETKKAIWELNAQDGEIREVIVTGGGSILDGFLERAEKILGKTVKMGFLYAVNDRVIQAQSAFYATSIGLIHFATQGIGNKSPYLRKELSFFIRALNQTRLLYQEYF